MWLMRLVARVLHLSIDVLKYDGRGRPIYTAGKLRPSYLDTVAVRRWFVCECGERGEARWLSEVDHGLSDPVLIGTCPKRCAGFMRFVRPLHQVSFTHTLTL